MEHARFIDSALAELAQWRAHSSEASRYPDDLYETIRERLDGLRSLHTSDDLVAAVDSLGRLIIDSGPLTGDFIPSFHELHGAIGRLERRKAGA